MTSKHPIPQMDEFRETLRLAARRDLAAFPPPEPQKPRRRRRVVALGVVGLAVAASGAGAAALIGVGEPVPDQTERDAKFRPSSTTPAVDVRAGDPDFRLPWAVGVYSTRDGIKCALAGQARGNLLGRIEQGVFRPYENKTAGACHRIGASGAFSDVRFFDGPPARTLIYGRTRSNVTEVRLARTGVRASARVGSAGSFLFVLDGHLEGGFELRLLPR